MTADADIEPINILLVEDNPADVRLTREAFKEGRCLVNLAVARDGVEALDVLHRRGRHYDAAPPDLILLDLNLPKIDGREVLREIKSDPALRKIPLVVLTTSTADQDVGDAYGLAANCYIQKPVDLDQFIRVVQSIENFWVRIVTLPRGMFL
ncbi:MAG: response regulator [Bryobacteraceae bacterium]|nr:response regulator [Bryobacteraceae bacterium]